MKNYDTKFIKEYIEAHKDEIDSVECGMQEDWHWTASTVYEDGEFDSWYDWGSQSINVAGIRGSAWATPVMNVCLKNGDTKIIPCYIELDGNETPSDIARMKAFAAATGGMDFLN